MAHLKFHIVCQGVFEEVAVLSFECELIGMVIESHCLTLEGFLGGGLLGSALLGLGHEKWRDFAEVADFLVILSWK